MGSDIPLISIPLGPSKILMKHGSLLSFMYILICLGFFHEGQLGGANCQPMAGGFTYSSWFSPFEERMSRMENTSFVAKLSEGNH